MSQQENMFDDENPSQAEDTSGKKYDGRFLPGKSSIKDDLQAIFEMEKEIGSAVFRLHKLVHLVQATSATAAKGTAVEESLEAISQSLIDNHTALQNRLNEADWQRMKIAAELTLKAHGVDPRTLAEESDSTKKLARWMNFMQIMAIGVVTTLLSGWILSSYSKSLLADQAEMTKETKQIIEVVKRQQQELSDHIARTSKK